MFEQLWKVPGEKGAPLTSPPPEVNARTIVELYRERWTMESALGELARWLHAEIAPSGQSPRGPAGVRGGVDGVRAAAPGGVEERGSARLADEGVEVDAVDAFQGRAKDAVVLSVVRANDRGELGFL